MKRFALMAVSAAALAACQAQVAAPTQDPVARGRYIVTAIGGCNDCHTPMTPQGPDMAHSLQGAKLAFGPLVPIPNWQTDAPGIAGDVFDEAHMVSVLTKGVRPDGTPTRPPMPAFRLTEEDAKAVAAYIKTLPRAS